MDANIAMCRLREAKQNAFDEACCAFATNHNMAGLARKMDMGETMLRNKLNPEQPHILTNVELVLITKASGNYTILNSLLLGLGVVTAHIPSAASEETVIKRALENAVHSGDPSRTALEHGGSSRISRSHKQTIIDKAHCSISNLVALISDLESRTTGITPLLSMSVDFIASGAPVPGLS